MAANMKAMAAEIRVTVNGAEFYSFARAMKRGFKAYSVGEVVMSLANGKLTISTKCSGIVLPCDMTPPLTARLRPGNFSSLVSLVNDADASGSIDIVFRPNLGEVALKHIGTKATFDKQTAVLPE